MGSIMINGVEFPAVCIDELPAVTSPAVGGAVAPVMLGGEAQKLSTDQVRDYLAGLGGLAGEDDVAAALRSVFGAGLGGMWRNEIMPTLDFDLTSRNGAPFRGNFTRSTNGGYVRNSRGVQVTTGVNEPLVNFGADGKPLGTGFHGAYTQLLLNSAALSTQNVTTTAQSYTLSFWGTGSVTLSGSATGTLVGTGADNRVSLTFAATAGTLTLTPSGSVTMAQLTAGSIVCPYVASTGATIARNGDSMIIGGTDFSDFYNPLEGTVCLSARTAAGVDPATPQVALQIGDGGWDNRIFIARSVPTRNMSCSVAVGGVYKNINLGVVPDETPFKLAVSWTATSLKASLNGAAPLELALTGLPVVDRVGVGVLTNGGQQWGGHISRVTCWPKALTGAQLQDMTR